MKLYLDLIQQFLEMKSGSIRFSDGKEYYTAIKQQDYILIKGDLDYKEMKELACATCELRQEISQIKDKLSRRNILITDLRGQIKKANRAFLAAHQICIEHDLLDEFDKKHPEPMTP